ncbi:hypothetical protein BACCOPRO_03538 [Phocaeicola coprophilus DSM 18228 = JCM 13818]|uniref:Uncharacterized protein n=1 Tax=Phocaeicola coprophilus DSM 18228 = JCM 13818 TaxID=547042 RepID=S0FD10_9BACT|nr:hypothetical protein BACCOPRO_03538 [Phocaeicola coprophilus DSM 18228 = JCM 13818]
MNNNKVSYTFCFELQNYEKIFYTKRCKEIICNIWKGMHRKLSGALKNAETFCFKARILFLKSPKRF